MKISFLGAAGEVTGSRFLVERGARRFLVDCGMFQGGADTFRKNHAPFEFEPARLDFVLLTHAHIDHSGLLPRLVAAGFDGAIHCTEATADLLEVMLKDTAHILEKEYEWALERHEHSPRRHKAPPEPLYTVADVERCIRRLQPAPYDTPFVPGPGVHCTFRDAGHILGSAIIEATIDEDGATRTVVFSGDLGQPGRPLVRDPARIGGADVLLIESTYGDRLHRPMEATLDELVEAVNDTIGQGNVVIPSFAVGRTQEILYLLIDLHRRRRLPRMEIYVDSPMATRATEITVRHLALLDEGAADQYAWLRSAASKPHVHFVEDPEASKRLNAMKRGAVIISASGMCDAGRIKHHLQHNIGRPECAIVIPGFQAAGTLGRRIVDGARHVRLFGEDVPVRARVFTIGGLSAHADQAALLDWLRAIRRPPRHVFVVHGERTAADAFAQRVRDDLGLNAVVPEPGATVEI